MSEYRYICDGRLSKGYASVEACKAAANRNSDAWYSDWIYIVQVIERGRPFKDLEWTAGGVPAKKKAKR
jgi:hypothetical protein